MANELEVAVSVPDGCSLEAICLRTSSWTTLAQPLIDFEDYASQRDGNIVTWWENGVEVEPTFCAEEN